MFAWEKWTRVAHGSWPYLIDFILSCCCLKCGKHRKFGLRKTISTQEKDLRKIVPLHWPPICLSLQLTPTPTFLLGLVLIQSIQLFFVTPLFVQVFHHIVFLSPPFCLSPGKNHINISIY